MSAAIFKEQQMYKGLISLACLVLFGLLSCSSDRETKEQGTIEQHTDKVGQEAVRMMKTPLDQARTAVGQENSHSQGVEQQVGKQ